MKFSRFSHLDHSSGNVSNSLAVREAIGKLALSPHETVKFLNGEKCIWSDSDDRAILCALSVLKRFYEQLRRDIAVQQKDPESHVDSKSLLRFLVSREDETARELISRHKEEEDRKANWVQLKIADRDSPGEIFPIPPSVPRLNERDLRSVTDYSGDSAVDDSEEDDVDGKRVRTEVDSSSSSSTPVNVSPNEKLLRETQKVTKSIFKMVHKVDKAISPRTDPKVSTPRTLREGSSTPRFIPQASKAIQTDFEVVRPKTADASVSVHMISEESSESRKMTDNSAKSSTTTSLGHLLGKSSGESTGNSSSVLSSGLSTGEIPLRTAATLTSKQKYKVLSVNTDGSLVSASSSYQAYKQIQGHHYHSNPSLMEAIDELVVTPMTSTPVATRQSTTFTANKPPRTRYAGQSTFPANPTRRISALAFGVSSDSEAKAEMTPLAVREMKLPSHTVIVTPASDPNDRENTAKKIEVIPSHDEDESTLNQISPLPSGD
ncbi:hypothetical protein FO519_006495 [Halicephalobus sp. NKZ332]|nr:hypothetical protein FO519_006495 [Halicephalobus sp. NKZ332]